MPKVSIIILTKNRAQLLEGALASVRNQSFQDFEVIVVDDGSTDETAELLRISNFKFQISNKLQIINHQISKGITVSRQEALEKSTGEYVAILDDDDEWADGNKLKEQIEFLDTHPETVLVGGGIRINFKFQISNFKFRPRKDAAIRKTMLFRNNFFTSTVIFRRETAIRAGGFVRDNIDLAEDYDLWLRMGGLGKMYNFPQVFAAYKHSGYDKKKFRQFLRKQLRLVKTHRADYPHAWFAAAILKLRLIAGI